MAGKTTAASLYYILSAVFFAACAWAQLNDPDPELWVGWYLTVGSAAALLALVAPMSPGAVSSAARAIAGLGFAGSIAVVVYLSARVVDRMQRSGQLREGLDVAGLPQSLAALGWAFLEHEEGREVGGLLLLALHGALVRRSLGSQARGRGPPAVLLLLALSAVSVAVYAWVAYQPAMVAKYDTEHCKGAFEGVPSGSGSSGAGSDEL